MTRTIKVTIDERARRQIIEAAEYLRNVTLRMPDEIQNSGDQEAVDWGLAQHESAMAIVRMLEALADPKAAEIVMVYADSKGGPA